MSAGLEDDLDSGDSLDDAPPIPSKKAVKGGKEKPAKKSGGSTFGLWLLVLLFLLAASAGGIYVFQDWVIKYWPPAEEYLIQAQLRHERPGAGFEIKRLGEIERGVHDNVEVVIIRGIIINVSNRTRPVPPMKLVLLDKAGHPLQEKIDKPPVASLDPAATSSFKIQLDHPDAEARSIVLEFVELPEAPAMGPSDAGDKDKPSTGLMTPPAPVPSASPVPAETPAPATASEPVAPAPAAAAPVQPAPAPTAPAAAPTHTAPTPHKK
jgi:hypothetical protein